MHSQLSMEDKYSSMLVVVLLTMTYGSGLPIMYLISMIYFFTCYWFDKFLIFHHHSKPHYFDEQLSLKITNWFKLGVVLHLIVGILMFSNAKILPVTQESYGDALQLQLHDSESEDHDEFEHANSHFSFGNI
jgi:hypothetical protein